MPNEEVRLLGLAEARRIRAQWVPHEIGARWRSQHKKIVSLSLCRNLKLKSNKKVSYLNKKSLLLFEFRDSFVWSFLYEHYVYMLSTFDVHFTISHMAIFVYIT